MFQMGPSVLGSKPTGIVLFLDPDASNRVDDVVVQVAASTTSVSARSGWARKTTIAVAAAPAYWRHTYRWAATDPWVISRGDGGGRQ